MSPSNSICEKRAFSIYTPFILYFLFRTFPFPKRKIYILRFYPSESMVPMRRISMCTCALSDWCIGNPICENNDSYWLNYLLCLRRVIVHRERNLKSEWTMEENRGSDYLELNRKKKDAVWNDDCVISSDKLWRSDPRGNKVPEW